jgi:hypothetical protein
MDRRDRLIVALSALLRAERETRTAFEEAIDAGLSREVLKAIVSDPIPVVTQFDLVVAENLLECLPKTQSPRAA